MRGRLQHFREMHRRAWVEHRPVVGARALDHTRVVGALLRDAVAVPRRLGLRPGRELAGAVANVCRRDAAVAVARIDLHRRDVPSVGRVDELREAVGVAVERLARLAAVALRHHRPTHCGADATRRTTDNATSTTDNATSTTVGATGPSKRVSCAVKPLRCAWHERRAAVRHWRTARTSENHCDVGMDGSSRSIADGLSNAWGHSIQHSMRTYEHLHRL